MDEKKEHWFKILGIILATFIGAFLAFYFSVDMTLNRMMNPEYNFRKIEKMMKYQDKEFNNLEEKFMDHLFVPQMAPMLVNLVKENDEYKIIVDLKPLGNDERNVSVNIDKNVITVIGDLNKQEKRSEQILNFSQSFYLDEELITNKISKEKKGNKYIITIPYKD